MAIHQTWHNGPTREINPRDLLIVETLRGNRNNAIVCYPNVSVRPDPAGAIDQPSVPENVTCHARIIASG